MCRHPGFFLFEFFLRLVVFLFSSTLFFQYYSIPSIVVSDWSPDCIFSAFLLFFFSSRSFEIGFKMAFSFFSFFVFIVFSISTCVGCAGGWMTIEAFFFSDVVCLALSPLCVCGRIAESRPFPGLFSLFLFSCYLTTKYLSELRYAARRLFNQN